MTIDAKEIRFDGVHCSLSIRKPAGRVVVMKIVGTDVGEFGDAPMSALWDCVGDAGAIQLFIDAREVQGASIEVSGEWANWMSANRGILESVTMLTGSRFIQITAEFVRRFSSMEGSMRVCTEAAVFDHLLREAVRG